MKPVIWSISLLLAVWLVGNAVGTGQRYNKELLMDGLPDNGAGSITGGDNMRRR